MKNGASRPYLIQLHGGTEARIPISTETSGSEFNAADTADPAESATAPPGHGRSHDPTMDASARRPYLAPLALRLHEPVLPGFRAF